MTNTSTPTVRGYVQQTYGNVMWRRLGTAVIALPLALRTVASRRLVRGIVALPLAAATTALTALLAGLTLINVGYPLRPVLGLGGNRGGGVWASTYGDAWGGPTLAGAWAVHAIGLVVFVFPPLAWAIRGLLRAQTHLAGPAPAAPRVRSQVPRPGRRRFGVLAAALLSWYALAALAHAAGFGDNVLWLPRDPRSALVLAVVLAPVVAAALTARTWWRPTAPLSGADAC